MNSNTHTRPRWLGYAEAAEYLGCTDRQVKRWVAQKRIAHTKLGLQVLFSQEHLDEFIEANTVRPVRPEAVTR